MLGDINHKNKLLSNKIKAAVVAGLTVTVGAVVVSILIINFVFFVVKNF